TDVSNFINVCGNDLACSDKYSCYEIPISDSNESIKLCTLDSDYCSCLFNYDISTQLPRPNVVTEIGNCTNSFTKNIISSDNARCLADLDIFCINNSDCSSGNCADIPKIYRAD